MSRRRYRILYSASFAFLFITCYALWYLLQGKNIIWKYDGLTQHLTVFSYIGKNIREIFRTLIFEHKLEIPMWDMAIGYGSDIPTTLAAYIYDPFNYLSVLFPVRYAEAGFTLMLVLKLYVTGWAFTCFCRYNKANDYPMLVGSLIYTFSGASFVIVFSVDFLNPMYIFPILMVGVLKIWNKENPLLYIVMLAISLVNYFYFAYMMCIFIALFCIAWIICDSEYRKCIRDILGWIFRFLGYSMLGAGIAMFALLPILYSMGTIDRLGVEHYLPLLYSKDIYGKLLATLLGYYYIDGRDAALGISALAVPCIISLFVKSKKKLLKILYVIAVMLLTIPFLGSIMNGFNYYCRRFNWAVVLLICYIIVSELEGLFEEKKKWKLILAVELVVIIIVCVLALRTLKYKLIIPVLICLLITVLLINARKISRKSVQIGILVLTGIGLISSHFLYFHELADGKFTASWIISNSEMAGSSMDKVLKSGGYALVAEREELDCTRYYSTVSKEYNSSWIHGISAMDFYISMYNGYIDRFHSRLAVSTIPSNFEYSGLDNREELLAITGVGEYIIYEDEENKLPYGYDNKTSETKVNDETILTYQSEKANQLVFSYENAIGYSEYDALSPYERQLALAEYCVVDDEHCSTRMPDNDSSYGSVPYRIECSKGISYEDGKVLVEDTEGYIEILLDEAIASDSDIKSQIYFYVEGLDYEGTDKESYSITVAAKSGSKTVSSHIQNGLTKVNHLYGDKHDWLLNLGWTFEDITSFKLYFSGVGEFTIDNIVVYKNTEEEIEKRLDERDFNAKEITIDTNRMSFDVSLDKSEYVYIAVPYQKGWTAYVDGEKCEILRANDAFMALKLEAGEHRVVLKYRTQGILAGLVITIISLILLFLICFKRKRVLIKE